MNTKQDRRILSNQERFEGTFSFLGSNKGLYVFREAEFGLEDSAERE